MVVEGATDHPSAVVLVQMFVLEAVVGHVLAVVGHQMRGKVCGRVIDETPGYNGRLVVAVVAHGAEGVVARVVMVTVHARGSWC